MKKYEKIIDLYLKKITKNLHFYEFAIFYDLRSRLAKTRKLRKCLLDSGRQIQKLKKAKLTEPTEGFPFLYLTLNRKMPHLRFFDLNSVISITLRTRMVGFL